MCDILEALETAHRVLLWADGRMASPMYDEVICNDARVLRERIDAAKARLTAPTSALDHEGK